MKGTGRGSLFLTLSFDFEVSLLLREISKAAELQMQIGDQGTRSGVLRTGSR